MWWRLLFTWKCIKIILFFYFLKITFDISTSKRLENTKKKKKFEAKKKKKYLNFFKIAFETQKQSRI
jgi:phosphotransferase system  glucose/maltose/N-acetylglucosamine-specific IIC component